MLHACPQFVDNVLNIIGIFTRYFQRETTLLVTTSLRIVHQKSTLVHTEQSTTTTREARKRE
jgi:hypothetical protein